jgi:hypothetical protein
MATLPGHVSVTGKSCVRRRYPRLFEGKTGRDVNSERLDILKRQAAWFDFMVGA